MIPSTRRLTAVAAAVIVLATAPLLADDLVRLERLDAGDRDALLAAGVPVVAELDGSLLAIGDGKAIVEAAAGRGTAARVLAPAPADARFALASAPFSDRGVTHDDCGETVSAEDDWVLLRLHEKAPEGCMSPSGWWIRELRRSPVRTATPPPPEALDRRRRDPITPDPAITYMVSGLTDSLAMAHWTAIVGAATTRYSTSAGCQDAAQLVHDTFSSLGLTAEYQSHTSGHAPNVIGTLPGTVTPQEQVIVIGHLDDMPSFGSAPGANDNASGAAMVTALAEVMSCTRFERTLKFIALTGEEFGLYGSEHYAAAAATAGDQIVAVLNADMIGWEGNGTPVPEDLDLNQNTASEWLGDLFHDLAAVYPTGAVVDNFTCNSMAYSDHWPFWQEGYPAVFGITDNHGYCGHSGTHPHYHQSSDTIANCGPGAAAFIGSSMRAFLATAAHLARPVGSIAPSPTSVAAVPAGDNALAVSWSPPAGAGEFVVERAAGGCLSPGPWQTVATTGLPGMTDSPVSGGVPYAYTVRALDASGLCLSGPSECAEGTTTGTCDEPPWFDGLTDATNLAEPTCRVALDWPEPNAVYCGPGRTFRVYRSTDPSFTPEPSTLLAGGLPGTTWTDGTDLVGGQQYHYVVRAVDAATGVEDDNLVRLSAVPTGPVALGTFADDAGDTGVAKLTADGPWTVSATGGHVAPRAYSTGVPPYPGDTCAAVSTEPLTLGAGAVLSFWSRNDIESGYDKGEVQISADGGTTWHRLEVGYPGTSSTSHSYDECGLTPGLSYFTGRSVPWAEHSASLAAWEGQEVIVRWLLSTDGSVEYDGWWIDEVEITSAGVPGPCASGPGGLFSDGFESGDTGAWSDAAP